MQRTYSDKLIAECKRVISKRSGIEITDDQAEAYLETLARVGFLALHIFEEQRKTNKHKKL